MSEVVPVFSQTEITRLSEIMGACRGIRSAANNSDESLMVSAQEVLFATIVFRLERIEQLLLEKRGR